MGININLKNLREQEQTLTFVPKIVAVFIGLMVCGSWILNQLSEFVTTLWSNFSIYLG